MWFGYGFLVLMNFDFVPTFWKNVCGLCGWDLGVVNKLAVLRRDETGTDVKIGLSFELGRLVI